MATSPKLWRGVGSTVNPDAVPVEYSDGALDSEREKTPDEWSEAEKFGEAELATIWPPEDPHPADDYDLEPPVLSDHAREEAPRIDDMAHVRKPEQKTAPQTGFNFRSIGELMNVPDVPDDWLLDGLLVRGTVGLLAAKPKTGKSVFARCLALAVAQGRPFLGRTTTQGEVSYLCLEERCQDVRRDFVLMGATQCDPLQVDDTAVPGISGLCAYILQRRPTFVVIDPLQRLLRIEDGNSYAQTYNAFSPLIECASKTNTHILVLHHSSSKKEREAIASPLGTTGLSAVAASILLLRSHGDQRSLETVQRIGNNLPRTLLRFDETTKTLSLGGSVAEAVGSRASALVLDLLARQGELTQKEIREQCHGIGSQNIRVALTTLLHEGKVQSAGEGKRGDPMRYSVSAKGGFSGFVGFPDTPNPHAKPETRNAFEVKGAVEVIAEEGGFGNRTYALKPENQKLDNTSQARAIIGEKVVSKNQKPHSVSESDADGPSSLVDRVPPTSVSPPPGRTVATMCEGDL